MKIVMGDFNAKIGSDNRGHERLMGTKGYGVVNENGEFCSENDLVIGDSLFQHKEIHKRTWKSSDGKTKSNRPHTY